MFNTRTTTNRTKSRVFQKPPVIMTGAVIFSTGISDDSFIPNIQFLISAEPGRGMILRGVYGK